MQASDSASHPEGFVVIATYGRSGSTLIQNLLNSIDGFCIRGENDNGFCPLARAWANLEQSTNLDRMRSKDRASDSTDPWFGAERVDADGFGRGLARSFTDHVLRPPAGTRVTGFKELRWPLDPEQFAIVLEFAHRFFPNTRVVFNIRNHDDVARSAWWSRMPAEKVHARLEQYETIFRSYLGEHPERAILLDYDAYSRDHEALRPLFARLGEPFDPDHVRGVLSRRLDHLK